MADYLHLFHNNSDYEYYMNNEYTEPFVGATNIGDNVYRINYNLTEYEKLIKEPLTFEITSDGNISWNTTDDYDFNRTIEYSKNGEEWTSITSTYAGYGDTIPVVSGDTVQFRGDNATYGVENLWLDRCYFGSTCGFKAKGNIMSLIDSTGFTSATTLTIGCTFTGLFDRCTGLTDASQLILPATTLANTCYREMFKGCNSLVNAPELPATTLANTCYREMFKGCNSLVNAPELPATTLANYCYQNMFNGCTSLVNAPELPATTLTSNCYYGMFQGCTSLVNAPSILPATTLASSCYYNMFNGCTSLVNAPELPATTLTSNCYYGMFADCTSLVNAPDLPATTLADSCYYYMFGGCTSLNYIKCLATDISASNCTSKWVSGVAATGTFIKNPNMSSWTTGINGIPNGWTVVDA